MEALEQLAEDSNIQLESVVHLRRLEVELHHMGMVEVDSRHKVKGRTVHTVVVAYWGGHKLVAAVEEVECQMLALLQLDPQEPLTPKEVH